MLVADIPVGSTPDTSNFLNQQYAVEAASYNLDAEILKWMDEGEKELNDGKRREIYSNAFGRMKAMSYALPISTWPESWIAVKDVNIVQRSWRASQVSILDFVWK